MTTTDTNSKTPAKAGWLKKLGVAGFLFFLIKGLVWIGIAVAAWAGFTW